MPVDFHKWGQQEMDFFTGESNIIDYGLIMLARSDGLNALYVSYKHRCFFCFFLLQKMVMYCSGVVTVHTAGRDEEHADEEVLQNHSL